MNNSNECQEQDLAKFFKEEIFSKKSLEEDNDEFYNALNFLEKSGITDHGHGIFFVKKDRVLTDVELKYLQFLINEWDYSFERV